MVRGGLRWIAGSRLMKDSMAKLAILLLVSIGALGDMAEQSYNSYYASYKVIDFLSRANLR
jgi:hypothetical protein